MQRPILFLLCSLITAGSVLFSCVQQKPAAEKLIAQTLLKQVDSFIYVAKTLQGLAEQQAVDGKQLQTQFLQLRIAYKKFEWAAEYFVPATSRFVNGPPVPEVEMSSHQLLQPAGLQVMEGLLFPFYDSSRKVELIRQLKGVEASAGKYHSYFSNIDLFDWQVFDASKLEIFRIETLGITGFDNPLTLRSMEESAASLQSLGAVISYYPPKEVTADPLPFIRRATKYLASHTDFNGFDRAQFITHYANPLSTILTALESLLKIRVIRYNRLLNQDARTLFDSNAFNVNAYAPNDFSFLTAQKVLLGKMLFADPILSGSGTRSCQSCHQPGKSFTDGLIKNTSLGDKTPLARNTPTLINAALQPTQFYDLRVNTLEDQSISVVQNEREMHGSMKLSVIQLWQNKVYRKLFSDAFPKKDRTGIDSFEVMNALGSFERSLVSLNSRFDEYMRGNKTTMDSLEIKGFNLFMGKARCATCHYMPLFNGNFPPRFIKIESEVIGVPVSPAGLRIDADLGRYRIIQTESFRHAFKIPTVRNAARTAPYMHNGVFRTLDQVIDFYNKGGGQGLGFQVENQTLPADKLHLSNQEKKELVAFIKSLDSD